jgi:hypothetical protein
MVSQWPEDIQQWRARMHCLWATLHSATGSLALSLRVKLATWAWGVLWCRLLFIYCLWGTSFGVDKRTVSDISSCNMPTYSSSSCISCCNEPVTVRQLHDGSPLFQRCSFRPSKVMLDVKKLGLKFVWFFSLSFWAFRRQLSNTCSKTVYCDYCLATL